jgi:hypothetical protein
MREHESSPEVRQIIEEMNALNSVLTASTPILMSEAREQVRAIEAASPVPVTVLDFVLRAAMSRITGTKPPSVAPEPSEGAPWTTRAFELVGHAWLAWARGDMKGAVNRIAEYAEGEEDYRDAKETEPIREGAVQLYSISLWATAIMGLLSGNMEEARRFYQRVHDVGASFGTESHPVILWTLAATFTPAG